MKGKTVLEQLGELERSDFYPYHMPGHKRNLAAALRDDACAEAPGNDARAAARSNGTAGQGDPSCALSAAAGLDITEIDGFDNLHEPEGILKEAMQKAARLYGADAAFYSVNGSTAGLLTAISAAVPEGGTLIMARNCHRAVYHAVYLRRINPVYLYPDTVPGIGIAGAITPGQVERALLEHPEAEAVLLTSPTYDGIVSDVERIAKLVHSHGKLLIVDAAHGAHFGFHPGFPDSPVQLGADLTVVSLHKTMPCLTQTALLHVKGKRVDRKRLRMFEAMYQTSSPSYLLMAAMDSCMEAVSQKGAGLWDNFWKYREAFFQKAKKLENIRIFAAPDMDAGKILIETGKTGLTGQQLYDILLERYHLQMEMAAGNYVTAIMTCCDTEEGWVRLADALAKLDRECPCSMPAGNASVRTIQPCPHLESACTLTEALDGAKKKIPVEKAAGQTAGGFVNLYPPGIPIVVPGERLSGEAIRLMMCYMQQNLPLKGIEDGALDILV